MKRLPLLLGFIVLAVSPVLAQGNVSGYAIALESGEPIQGALVMLKDSLGLSIPQYAPVPTDSRGYFAFEDVPMGRYALHASAFYDIEGDRIEYYMTTRMLDVGETGAQVNFGYSKVALHEFVSRSYPSRKRFSRDGLQQARAQMIRSHIMDDRGMELVSISGWERVRTQR